MLIQPAVQIRSHHSLSLVVLLLLFSCNGPPPEAGHAFSIHEEDGVTVSTSSGSPRFRNPLFRFEKVLELGTDTSEEEAILASPAAFTQDLAGHFYVLDGERNRPRVVVYDSAGRYVRTIGRGGAGPGEFWRPTLQGIQDGLLEVYDQSLTRTTRFTPSGEAFDVITLTEPLPRMEALYRSRTGATIAVQFLLEVDEPHFLFRRTATVIPPEPADPVVLQTPWVKSQRSIVTGQAPDGFPLHLSRTIAFCGTPTILYGPGDLILLSTGEEPVLQWYDTRGGLRRSMHLEITPQSVSGAEKRAVRALMKQISARDRDRGIARYDIDKLIEFRDPKAYWSRVDIDDRGWLWLEYPHSTISGEPDVRRLVSPEGEYLGDVAFPESGGIVRSGHYLVLVRNEATGEWIPTVFRMSPLAAGFEYP